MEIQQQIEIRDFKDEIESLCQRCGRKESTWSRAYQSDDAIYCCVGCGTEKACECQSLSLKAILNADDRRRFHAQRPPQHERRWAVRSGFLKY
jgi:hypothetical protein